MPRKICIITSNRADWGLLQPVATLLKGDKSFGLQIIATGQHLERESGHSIDDIAKAGFKVDATVDMALTDDSPAAIAAGLARCIEGIGAALAQLKPDLVMLLGDRYEILGAATATNLARIPIAHLCGGDVTEGAMDDSFRHAITKLSHLHFVTNAEAAKRVRQMGEAADRVFNVGSTGIDSILQTAIMPRDEFFAAIGFTPRAKNILCTYHPETLNPNTVDDCKELLRAIDSLGGDVGVIFTGTNNDVHGRTIQRLLSDFVAAHDNCILVPTLGSQRYYSALTHTDLVVGNSSSGLAEAPSFGIRTVNIGHRQHGRPRASTVLDVAAQASDIFNAIVTALKLPPGRKDNPYGDGNAAAKILGSLKQFSETSDLIKKTFSNSP